MKCTSCGTLNSPEASFCGACGLALVSATPSSPETFALDHLAEGSQPILDETESSPLASLSEPSLQTSDETEDLSPAGASEHYQSASAALEDAPTAPESSPGEIYQMPAAMYAAPPPESPSGVMYSFPPPESSPGAVYAAPPPGPGQLPYVVGPGGGMFQPAFAAPGQPGLSGVSRADAYVKPLPRPAVIGGSIALALVLLLLCFFAGPDWASGALVASWVSFLIGIAILLIFLGRVALGLLKPINVHRRAQVLSALLASLILFVLGTVDLTAQTGFHAMQARALEGQQKWSAAISEYQASGEVAPTSVNLARTYEEWGQQLAQQQQYAPAVERFDTVITEYAQAESQVDQAQKDELATYLAWGNHETQLHEYAQAADLYNNFLAQPSCQVDTHCQSTISTVEATAYYSQAEKQLLSQNYQAAVAAFQALTTRFPTAPEAKKVHADYATALWSEAKAEVTTSCSGALFLYQQLVTSFADTTDGRVAATTLAQPVSVKGHFTKGVPGGSNVGEVGLIQGITPAASTDQFYSVLGKSPLVAVGKDGSFTFPSIKQGTYYLVWGVVNTNTGDLSFFDGNQDNTYNYIATVGSLCSFDFGNLSEAFPTA